MVDGFIFETGQWKLVWGSNRRFLHKAYEDVTEDDILSRQFEEGFLVISWNLTEWQICYSEEAWVGCKRRCLQGHEEKAKDEVMRMVPAAPVGEEITNPPFMADF